MSPGSDILSARGLKGKKEKARGKRKVLFLFPFCSVSPRLLLFLVSSFSAGSTLIFYSQSIAPHKMSLCRYKYIYIQNI